MVAPIHIPDVQASGDARQLAIQEVGVKGIRYPITVWTPHHKTYPSIATCSMVVNLPKEQRGTHMSRFVEALQSLTQPITLAVFSDLLTEMTTRLNASYGLIKMSFPYFINKTAPVSGAKGLLDYDVMLIGEKQDDKIALCLKVIVPVTSLCPCSKEISAYGAHNQRSHITAEVVVDAHSDIWFEDLIVPIEKQASCELYSILKRQDEKFVTEHAYDHPKFAEDLVRDVAKTLDQDPRITHYTIEAENFESIHTHSAYALLRK